jgi:hypothetical protein
MIIVSFVSFPKKKIIVKASNFGPNGNFEPLLTSSVSSLNESRIVPKMNSTEFANLKILYNFNLLHSCVGRVLMIASPPEKSSKFT